MTTRSDGRGGRRAGTGGWRARTAMPSGTAATSASFCPKIIVENTQQNTNHSRPQIRPDSTHVSTVGSWSARPPRLGGCARSGGFSGSGSRPNRRRSALRARMLRPRRTSPPTDAAEKSSCPPVWVRESARRAAVRDSSFIPLILVFYPRCPCGMLESWSGRTAGADASEPRARGSGRLRNRSRKNGRGG